MLQFFSVAFVVLAVFGASLVLERLLGRSRKEMQKPGWFVVFFVLFAPAVYLVHAYVDVGSQYAYAAYAASAGVPALIAQAFFGALLPEHSSTEERP